MSIEKKFLCVKDSIEAERIKAMLLLSDLDEQMLQLTSGQLISQKGIELAEMMDALLIAERNLRYVVARMESIGKAG